MVNIGLTYTFPLVSNLQKLFIPFQLKKQQQLQQQILLQHFQVQQQQLAEQHEQQLRQHLKVKNSIFLLELYSLTDR